MDLEARNRETSRYGYSSSRRSLIEIGNSPEHRTDAASRSISSKALAELA